MKRAISKNNPYEKSGDIITKQIIDRALKDFKRVENSSSAGASEKTIGEMEDEILKRVHEKIEYI